MSVHRIRLREPWRHFPAESELKCGQAGKLDVLYGRQLRAEEKIEWRRRFNCPSGLAPEQRIWVVVENRSRSIAVYLNGRHLGQTPAGAEAVRFEVTGLLDLHNEITLMATDTPSPVPSSLPAEVSLEIVDFGS